MVNIRLENEAGKSVTEKVYLYKEQEELVDYINKKIPLHHLGRGVYYN